MSIDTKYINHKKREKARNKNIQKTLKTDQKHIKHEKSNNKNKKNKTRIDK